MLFTFVVSCKKKQTDTGVIASFTYKIDTVEFKKVTFASYSQSYSSLSWNFGDSSAVSSEINPIHVYSNTGDYTVVLTARSLDGSSIDVYSAQFTIANNIAEMKILTGSSSKTWKLIRVTTTGRYPLEVGPIDHSVIWWAMGLNNDELALRPCLMNDEWTFYKNKTFTYASKGDFWAETGVFYPANVCAPSTPEYLVGPGGIDLSAWGDGTHTFILTGGSSPTLEVDGLGAYIGNPKIATEVEVKVPQTSVKYQILKLSGGVVDTLVLNVNWKYSFVSPSPDAYWKIVLVHYSNPADEPPIPSPTPKPGFTVAVNGLNITCTNTSTLAQTYLWEFGDGGTSTLKDPTHAYTDGGVYKVKLIATNTNGSTSTKQEVFISAVPLTEALLQGPAWKVRVDTNSIFCGSGLGKFDYFSVSVANLNGSTTGADDWSCITNDEFTFSAGGVYNYNTNGDARNDGYMGSPNGCISDAQLAASGNGAAFGTATHAYSFTPATATTNAVIDLTNIGSHAAFIGFYKGYYGGENANKSDPPNGGNTTNKYYVMGYAKSATKEYLFITVDYSATHDGSKAWSAILVR
jgi:PKD repeat protein